MLLWWILFSSPAHAVKPVWTEWYLVSQKGAPLSYFEEIYEKRPADKHVAITQKWVEKIGARQEIYIGSVAQESNLEPVAFFVERKGGKAYKTDGRAKGKKVEITFKPASADLAKSTEFTELKSDMLFSSFVPLAISRKFPSGKGAFSFTALVEDAGDMSVEVKKGIAEIQADEQKIGAEKCKHVLVQFDGKLQEWWITAQGKVCRVEFPDTNTRMELSTEAAAKKALKEKP